jgi:competence protein ComGC
MQNDKTKECANPCKRCQETGECAKNKLNQSQILQLAKDLNAAKTKLGTLQHGGLPVANPQREAELQNEITQLQNQLLKDEH